MFICSLPLCGRYIFLGAFAYRDVGKGREQERKLCVFARDVLFLDGAQLHLSIIHRLPQPAVDKRVYIAGVTGE